MKLARHFQGTHALITGGSTGIGLALARRLVDLGAGVTLVARRPQRLAEAAAELEGRRAGARVRTLALDVSDERAVSEALPAELAAQPLDMLVSNAAISEARRFLDTEPARLRAHIEVNYLGTVWMSRAVVPHFLERGSGRLLIMGSMASLVGVYGYSAYTPPKFALYGLADVLRAELGPLGIAVSIALPNSTETAMLAHERETAPPETQRILAATRVASPERVAETVLRGVARGRFEIVPGLENRAFARLNRLVPSLGRALLDRQARGGRSAQPRGAR